MLARSDNVVRAFRNFSVVNHPNVVALRAVFTTGAFAALDPSRHLTVAGAEAATSENGSRTGGHPSDLELVFVYDIYPSAKTMHEYYFCGDTSSLSEELFWILALQLVSALRSLHLQYHLTAYGAIGARHVLVVSPHRLKLNKIGIAAAFDPDDEDVSLSKTNEYQRQDWIALHDLLLALAARSNPRAVRHGCVRDPEAAIETVRGAFSQDVEQLLRSIANPSQSTSESWNRLLTERLWRAFELSLNHGDILETIAQDAVSDGELFIVGTKLACVTERADLIGDPHWSEIGDRYLLKLFRDRVFHGAELHLDRIRDELRRLNAGTAERILLESRDGRSRLLVTYADLSRFLETALRELASRLAEQYGSA
jgi:PAB-dependent poly(A)-specific ribonuclease subunit 3